MIYARFLLWALIAPFTLTLQVQQFLPDHEINEESEGELNSVQHSIRKRSIPEISVNINSHGVYSKYILQSSEGFFAGKNTKVWKLKKNRNRFRYYFTKNIMENANILFYRDQKTMSEIIHTVNKRDVSEFNGIIDNNTVIRSLNNKNQLRRDTSSNLMHESPNNKLKNDHVLYKRDVPQSNSGNTNFHEGRRPFAVPQIVYPQILVFVDLTLYLQMQGNDVKTVSYVLTLLNGVDLYFREITKPIIRLNIAAIVLCEDSIGIFDDDDINGNTLERFSKFMYNNRKFRLNKDYDIAVLLVKPKTIFYNSNDLSRTGTVCKQGLDGIESVAIINDYGRLEGIRIGARELGHVLGSSHYDPKNLNEEVDKKCSIMDSMLMSNHQFDENQFYFSSCFRKEIAYHLSSKEAECILNNPAVNRTDDQILKIFPGQFMPADKQCYKAEYKNVTAVVTPNICSRLACNIGNIKFLRDKPALEGTPCDLGKICLRGECVKLPYKDSDKKLFINQLKLNHYLPPQNNKSLKEQCKEGGANNAIKTTLNDCELECVYADEYGHQHVKNISAQDGTICKNIGFCREGKCIDNNFETANEYCIKAGKNGLNRISEECTFICEREIYPIPNDLYKSFHERKLIFERISAPNGFSCSNNRNCSNGKCTDMTSTISTIHHIDSTTSTSINKPVKFKSAEKRCRDIEMSFYAIVDEGCRIYCINRTATRYKNGYNSVQNKHMRIVTVENGFYCLNNGYCQEGKCINMTTTTSTVRTIDSTTLINKPVKFKSAEERCRDIEMSFHSTVDEGCHIYCINRTATRDKNGYYAVYDKYVRNFTVENGFYCQNNGYCQEGKCINMTSTTSALHPIDSTARTTTTTTSTRRITDSTQRTVSSTGSSTPFDEPVKFLSRIERCREIKMSLSDIELECQFICINENKNEHENEESENSEDIKDHKYIEDYNGFPCNNFGYCENGECVNMTAGKDKSGRTFSEQCEDLGMELSYDFNDGCMAYCENSTNNYDDELFAENGHHCRDNGVCSDGICFENKVTSITPASTIRTTPLIRSIDEFDSPRKRCDKLGFFLSYKHMDKCTIMCTSKNELDLKVIFKLVPDKETIKTQLILAENGYPCETNKHCSNGRCVFYAERN